MHVHVFLNPYITITIHVAIVDSQINFLRQQNYEHCRVVTNRGLFIRIMIEKRNGSWQQLRTVQNTKQYHNTDPGTAHQSQLSNLVVMGRLSCVDESVSQSGSQQSVESDV